MIGIQPDQINGKYYVGEDVIIQASLRNDSKILCMTWQNETENGSNTIDTSLEKYMESRNDETCEYTLTIRNCDELDKGTYFLLTACTDNLKVKSNRIKLDFVRGKTVLISNITHVKIGGREFKHRRRLNYNIGIFSVCYVYLCPSLWAGKISVMIVCGFNNTNTITFRCLSFMST